MKHTPSSSYLLNGNWLSIQHLILSYILIYLCSISYGNAQTPTEANPKLIVKARVTEQGIKLRWAVDNKYAWKYGNQYGYILERTTVMRDGAILAKPEKIILSGDTILPKPIQAWEALATTNDKAAIAAQAIHGDTFEVNTNESNTMLKVIHESEALNRRFGFALFAIDQDFKIAQLAGLGYTDTTALPNEKYLYTVKSAIPKKRMTVTESGVYIGIQDKEPLPQPYDFFGYYYKEAFVLVWEYDALLPYYSAYHLERSTDSIHFKRINKTPITKLADTPYSGISFTDSIPKYNTPYWYRIVGLNYFDEESPASKPIPLIAIKALQNTPSFKSTKVLPKDQVALTWEFPEEERWKLRKYELLRAEKAIGPYTVVKDSIASDQLSCTYSPIRDINYFKIKAIGKQANDYKTSRPAMVQPIDSIPPKQPTGLQGRIDTLGVVTLQWDKNKALDLRGYSLLRAYRNNQEFTKLNVDYLTQEQYTDTIDMTSFDTSVRYCLRALDQRYNESIPSDTLILQKPDRIPPTTPIFNTYRIDSTQVFLSWTPSASKDVEKTVLYRKDLENNTATAWETIYTTTDTHNYLDTSPTAGHTYTYTLIAVDQSGLESVPTSPLQIQLPKQLLVKGVKGLYATVDRELNFIDLSWRLQQKNAIELLLYRTSGENSFSLYRQFTPETKRFIDTNVTPNTHYTYGIRVVFADGSMSAFKTIKVVY